MSFAERHKFIAQKSIQLNDMDSALRNRLYNVIHKYLEPSPFIQKELAYVVDKLGMRVEDSNQKNWGKIDTLLLKTIYDISWYMPYEIIELFFEAKRHHCQLCEYDCHEKGGRCEELIWFDNVSDQINKILEDEKSGYRFVEDKFINITSNEEIKTIKDASNTAFSSVNTHLEKALGLYADRQHPDYENSIKESISAVEAMCCIITNITGAQATLRNALKNLEDNGIVLHGALKSAFDKLYGYTSDASGIRHGGIDFTNASAEDAKYMLISCSAFVNYLVEKYSQISKSTT